VEPIAPDLLALLCELESSPALILTDRLDVLARNPLAEMLHAGFASADNTARMVFADPAGRSFYQQWDDAATTAVATLQTAAGLDPGDERLRALVPELAGDIIFTKLWSRQIVRTKTAEVKHFQHPEAGPLRFAYRSFDIRGTSGQQLVVFGRIPGDNSAERLAAHITA